MKFRLGCELAYKVGETAIYARSSSKAPVPSCYDRPVRQNPALDRG